MGGRTYFNANYAALREVAHDGLYAVCNKHMVGEAIRLRASSLNVFPTMRGAKGRLGYRPLSMSSLFAATLSCSRPAPRQPHVEDMELSDAHKKKVSVQPKAKGGKRAARKQAKADVQKTATESSKGQALVQNTSTQSSNGPVDVQKNPTQSLKPENLDAEQHGPH